MNREHFRLTNYHSHTPRCMHATGTEEEYVLQAIQLGYEILGFSDHTPWPYKSDFVANMRMRLDQLDGYISTLRALEREYADRIRIRVGLECEAFPEFFSWLRETREEKGLDFIILGNHHDTNDEHNGDYFGRCTTVHRMRRYVDTTIIGMESGLFDYLAHPDLCLERYPRFDGEAKRACRELCETAKRMNLPLEYNILGRTRHDEDRKLGGLGYTTREFWEVAAETGNRAIIGVDAHRPAQLDCLDYYREARDMFESMGIEVLETLDEI